MTRLVDTNVLYAANDAEALDYDPACVLACVRLLRDVKENGILALDDKFEILREYRRNAKEAGMPGVGDEFLKWALSNAYVEGACAITLIERHPDRVWTAFPDADDVANFDRSDRKFVAVALTHPDNPPIHNVGDSDWHEHHDALVGHGVRIVQLCPERLDDRT